MVQKIFSIILAISIGAVSLSLLLYSWAKKEGILEFSDQVILSTLNDSSQGNSIVLDRNGNKIGEFFERYHRRVTYRDLPDSLVKAIIAIEDKRFFSHSGVDVVAMLRAAISILLHGSYTQGGSTITQQIARNLFLNREKTITRKIKEVILALKIEQLVSKEKILEIYVNRLFLGFGSYGIEAASQRLFAKPIHKIGVHQHALLAGLFQSPTKYSPYRNPGRAKSRQRQVLEAMVRLKFLTKKDANTLFRRNLSYVPYTPVNYKVAPHFIDYIKKQVSSFLDKSPKSTGLRIYTTLDPKLQNIANDTFTEMADHFDRADWMVQRSNPMSSDAKQPYSEAALLTIDPRDGSILAMKGGRNYQLSQFNRAVSARRSPGSGFKPIVYSLALSQGKKWSDLILVSPVSINGYRPKDYGKNTFHETTMFKAFYNSINTATVEIGSQIGIESIIAHAKKLGIHSPLKKEPGTLLGSSEVTMLDLARVYSSFANGGKRVSPYAISRIEDSTGKVLYLHPSAKNANLVHIIPTEIAFLTTQGMHAVLRRGTGAASSHLAKVAAGKTGTSNQSRDNWFTGYTSNLLTSVWVGNDNHLPLGAQASGSKLALPIWDRFMTRAIKQRKPEPFSKPDRVESALIHVNYGHQSPNGTVMYFLRNQRPSILSSDYQQVKEAGNFRPIFRY